MKQSIARFAAQVAMFVFIVVLGWNLHPVLTGYDNNLVWLLSFLMILGLLMLSGWLFDRFKKRVEPKIVKIHKSLPFSGSGQLLISNSHIGPMGGFKGFRTTAIYGSAREKNASSEAKRDEHVGIPFDRPRYVTTWCTRSCTVPAQSTEVRQGVGEKMKKKTIIIIALLGVLLSTAAACPVRTGYVANGQFRNTTGLLPLCTAAFKKLATEVKEGEYEESYRTTFDLKGALAIRKLSGLLTSNGWKQTGASNKGQNKTLVFDKGSKQTVIGIKEVPVEKGDDYVLVIVVGDK